MYQNAFYILGGKDFCFKDNSSLNTVFGHFRVKALTLIRQFRIKISIEITLHTAV